MRTRSWPSSNYKEEQFLLGPLQTVSGNSSRGSNSPAEPEAEPIENSGPQPQRPGWQLQSLPGVRLLIRQDKDQRDRYKQVVLKQYSMDALKAVISVELGIAEDSIAELSQEVYRKDGKNVWVTIRTDEHVMQLKADDCITIVNDYNQ